MADEPITSIGTSALRSAVAGVRAGAGANARIAPAPPPDQAESPWAGHRQPRPQTLDDERKEAAVAAVTAPPPKPKPPKGKNAKVGQTADMGFELVNAILDEWTRNVKNHNIGYANNRMAQRLIRNGALLIRDEYKIDQLAALIRLGNELVKNTMDEGDEDKRIDEFRKKMERADMTGTVPENASAGEEEPPEDEDGE